MVHNDRKEYLEPVVSGRSRRRAASVEGCKKFPLNVNTFCQYRQKFLGIFELRVVERESILTRWNLEACSEGLRAVANRRKRYDFLYRESAQS